MPRHNGSQGAWHQPGRKAGSAKRRARRSNRRGSRRSGKKG